MAKLIIVSAQDAPLPSGHYSPGIIHNGVLYVSGQLPRVPGQPADFAPATIEAQTRQALINAEAVLLAAGSRRDLVLRSTLYVSDIAHWAAVNAEYAAFFGEHKPARAIVPVGKFKSGFLIEIDMIAAIAD
ncbi:MAG: RidA family protein [Betaproteobacteria bacterium]